MMQEINHITRTAPPDDDNIDHIGTDTPGSGIATPQPDPHDKRLPGIMSYFGQVRQDSLASLPLSAPTSNTQRPLASSSGMSSSSSRPQAQDGCVLNSIPSRIAQTASTSSLPAVVSTQLAVVLPSSSSTNAYPTPPTSHPCSSASSMVQTPSASEKVAANTSSASEQNITAPSVTDADEMVPRVSQDAQYQIPDTGQIPSKWFSFDTLKELTRSLVPKSGPPTPTRALSAAQSSQSEGKEPQTAANNDGAEKSGTQTPRSGGAQAPAAKGKLTIKIAEARGLRKCRDPYVVAVFQRSELISGGPRPSEDDENLSATPTATGSIAIQRQASDSGRPMAIPMRSRQSSNTSISDYNTFRNRSVNKLFTNPKWDAEAVLYVTKHISMSILK